MNVRSFFDTNVLLYTDDLREQAKQTRALDLIRKHRSTSSGVISLQVLQEYFAGAVRKFHIDAGDARRKVEIFAEFDVVVPVVDDLVAAIDLYRLHKMHFWDALIIRAAKKGSCSILFSEDMQHGRVVDGIRIVNPFI